MIKSSNIRFKEIRSKLGLTQQQFADSLGIKQAHVSGIEIGAKEVSKKLMLTLFKKFNVSAEYFLHGKGNMFEDSSSNEGFLKLKDNFKSNTEKADPLIKILYLMLLERDKWIWELTQTLYNLKVSVSILTDNKWIDDKEEDFYKSFRKIDTREWYEVNDPNLLVKKIDELDKKISDYLNEINTLSKTNLYEITTQGLKRKEE